MKENFQPNSHCKKSQGLNKIHKSTFPSTFFGIGGLGGVGGSGAYMETEWKCASPKHQQYYRRVVTVPDLSRVGTRFMSSDNLKTT